MKCPERSATPVISMTPAGLATRFIGLKEVRGSMSNPQILSMLNLDKKWPKDDSVAWCSAFVNYVCWLLNVPRSHSLKARSWLEVGREVPSLPLARLGWDVVVLKRGRGLQPGPDVLDAPGHVGFFVVSDGDKVSVLGGNQKNKVCIAEYSRKRVLQVRRLLP